MSPVEPFATRPPVGQALLEDLVLLVLKEHGSHGTQAPAGDPEHEEALTEQFTNIDLEDEQASGPCRHRHNL